MTTLDIGGTDVTSTAAELNVLDGNTSATSTTIVNADRLILNDDGTMKQIAMTDLANYVASGSDLDILADAKSGGTNFTESLLLGHETTGTLNAAEYNTGVGRGSLDAITEGDQNTAMGYNSLSANTAGTGNVAFGYNTLAANTTAGQNLAVGYNALAIQTTGGEFNTGIGNYSLDANTIGDKNVALGYGALTANSEGSFNVGIGAEALKINNTGANNTAIGNAAGDVITTGSYNVVIGSGSDPSADNGSNQTVVGYDVTGQSNNSVTLGNADVTAVYMAQDAGATIHATGVTSASNGTLTIDPNGSGTLALGSADNTQATIDAVAFSIDATGGASNISLTADGAADDLTVAVTGSQDASLVLSSAGTGADAVQLTASAGGMDISASSGVDFNASKIDNYSANVETGSPSGNALAISASYNGTVLLIDDGAADAVQVLTLADDLPVGFNFMVVQTGDYKIKLAATTATDLVGQGITDGTSGYLWSNGLYSVITVVVIADGKYVMSGDRSNSAS